MGLEAAEFVIAIEQAFGIAIPDGVAVNLLTPRMLADYIESRLPAGVSDVCHTHMAFHRLRRAVMKAHEVPREAITPTTRWRDLLPDAGFGRRWRQLGSVVGARDWPPAPIFGFQRHAARTVGETARYLARRSPALLKGAEKGWTRLEIERVIAELIEETVGIKSFGWDQSFVDELGFS